MLKFKSKLLGREAVGVGLIIVVAAVVRIAFPGWTEFKGDEARLMALAWDMVTDGKVALRGISSSVGIPNFPASVWLYAIPVLIWDHVYAATIFTGLLNTAAVALTYLLVRRYWGPTPALVAALMFAVSPWAIIHSRKIWAQNLIPFFAVLWGYSGLQALVARKPRWLIVHLSAAVFAFQIHLAALSLMASSAVLMVVFWRSIRWRDVGWATAVTLILTAPFGLYLSREGAITLSSLAALGQSSADGGGWSWSWNPILHAVRLFTGWQSHALVGGEAFQIFSTPDAVGTAIHVFWLLLFASGLWGIWRVKSDSAADLDRRRFMIVWLIVPLATFLWFPIDVELHYLLPYYPVPFIAAALGFDLLFQRARAWGWAAMAASAGGQLYIWGALLIFLVTQATPGGFGTPLQFQLIAAEYAVQLVESGRAHEILVAGPGNDPALDGQAAVFDFHLRRVPHRFVDLDSSAVFPAHDSGVLIPTGRFPLGSTYEMLAADVRRFPLRRDEGVVTVYSLPGGTIPPMARMLESEPLLANFVALLGHSPLSARGEWQVLWRVGVPAAVDYHIFNHLHDVFGERIAQADDTAFPAAQWQENDVVLSRFVMEVPVSAQKPWTMRTGMYRYPSLENVPLLDEAANPYTDAAEFLLLP